MRWPSLPSRQPRVLLSWWPHRRVLRRALLSWRQLSLRGLLRLVHGHRRRLRLRLRQLRLRLSLGLISVVLRLCLCLVGILLHLLHDHVIPLRLG